MPGRSLAFIEADFERVDRAEKRLEAVTRRTRAGSWRPTPQRKPAQESPVPASLLRLDLHAPAVGVGATITDMRTEAEAVVSARAVASKEDALRQSQAMARVAATAPVSPSDDVSQYQDGQGPRTAVPAAARPAPRNGPGRPAPLASKPSAPQPRAPTLLGPNFLFGPGGRAFPHRNVPQVAVVPEPAAATETVGEAPDAWANPLLSPDRLQSPDSTGPSPRVGSVLTSPQKRRERAAADARRLERFVNQSPIRLRRPASGQSRPPKAAQPGDMNFDRMATNFFRSLPPAVPPHSRPATAHRAVSAVSRRDSVPKQHRARPSSAALWDGSAPALRAPVVAPADTQSPAPDAAPLEPDFYYLHVRLAHAHGQGMGNWVFTLTVTDVTPGAVPRSHSVANLRVNREGHLVFHPPHGVILSPCDDIPWVARPEDMYLRTLRLEVVSTYPTSSKVLESMVYYGDVVPGGSA